MTKRACPACPDGNEWDRNGPTGRACKTCGGKAYIDDDSQDDEGDPPSYGEEGYEEYKAEQRMRRGEWLADYMEDQ